MLSDRTFADLQEHGYAIVTDVMTKTECDMAIGQYRDWLSQFQDGDWPSSFQSLIQRYNTGHMEPTWFVRLKAKKVFSQIWKTDKLLSSFDAIAIGRPPEDGEEPFHDPDVHWLHHDQGVARVGLHAYQGAVYLEDANDDDWTFYIMDRSHQYFQTFYHDHPKATMKSMTNFTYWLKDEDIKYFKTKGCELKRLAVPKGGMVLWDSRLVHANAPPVEDRKHPGRWRYCVFVSMTPAIWSSKTDMRRKREAYKQACMTTHWSSQDVKYYTADIPITAAHDIDYPKTLPEIAKTREAKLLSGVIQYDFRDGNPTGEEYKPIWQAGSYGKQDSNTMSMVCIGGGVLATILAVGIGIAMYTRKR